MLLKHIMLTMLPIYLKNVGVNMILVRRAARLWGGKKKKITIFFRKKYLLQLLPVTKEQNQKDKVVLCARLAHRDERGSGPEEEGKIFQEGCRMCRSPNLRSKVDVNRKLVPH